MDIPGEFRQLFEPWWREAAVYGGRYSLKSHSISRFLLVKARESQKRIACFREYQNSIAESSHQLLADLIHQYELNDFKVSDSSIVNRITGSDFLFKGLWHNEQSIKSIEGIDLAWIEEAQTVTTPSIEVLTPTVRKSGSQIVYSYNRLLEDDPVHQRLVIEGRPNTLIINVNYDIAIKHGMMPDVIRAEIEDDKAKRPALYKHKWLGEPNTSELKIYSGWQFIDGLPPEARLERYGLDFGYSNDPTAIVAIYTYNGTYILDEIAYLKGLSYKQIADIFLNLKRAMIVADSADPRGIDELRSYGLNVMGVKKVGGKGSSGHDLTFRLYCIDVMQSQNMSVTKRSTNIIKEYNSYLWLTDDKTGKTLNEPSPVFDHTMNAAAYGMVSIAPIIRRQELIDSLPEISTGKRGNIAV